MIYHSLIQEAKFPFGSLTFTSTEPSDATTVGGILNWTIKPITDCGYVEDFHVYFARKATGAGPKLISHVPIGTNSLEIPSGTNPGGREYIIVHARNRNGPASAGTA